jgi:RimJ/RimL family protein N-acetyltransferase
MPSCCIDKEIVTVNWLTQTTLKGEHVTLEPLSTAHIEGLKSAVMDGESFKLWYANVPTPAQMENYVEEAILAARSGNLAFAVIDNTSGNVVGTTRFYSVDTLNNRAMLGFTWYSHCVRRTSVNTECKFLLLTHAFDSCGAIAVEFRTHSFNQASRTAIERLGAKFDGVLRSHQVLKDGSIRDTVVYSIIKSEWPCVSNNLLSKLSRSVGQ